MWRLLKAKPMGVKFRCQHPLSNYVVDFYCHAARSVFEIDGISHDMGDQPAFDHHRDAELTAAGFKVIRILATDVLRDPQSVAESMVSHCQSKIPMGALH